MMEQPLISAEGGDPLLETQIARPAPRPERPRPGRFRRWVLRPVIWLLAGLAVTLLLLQALVDTGYVRRWAGGLVAEELGAALDRRVEIGDLKLTLLPLSLEVWGVKIHGPAELDAVHPFIEIPFAAVDADLNALQQNIVRLQEVRVERPRLYLQFVNDTSNVLKLHGKVPKKRKTRRFDVFMDRIEVDRAEVVIDQETVRLSISGDAVRARFQGRGHLHVDGQLAAQNVVVRLPNAKPVTVAVSGKGSIRRGKITIETARASGRGFSARGFGECGWPLENTLDKRCKIEISGTSSGEKLASMGYFPHLTGDFDFDGEFFWRPRTFGWQSQVRADELTIWGRPLLDVDTTLVADRYQVRVDLVRAFYGGGTLDGSVNVATKEPGRPVVVNLDFDGVALDQVLADQSIPVGPFASRLSGHLLYRSPLEEGTRGSGRGEVTVHADRELEGIGLAGSFPLRIENGVVRTEAVSLGSEDQSLLASGFYDVDRRRGIFDYEIHSADVMPLVAAMQLVEPDEPWPRWLPTAGEGGISGTLRLLPGTIASDIQLQLEKTYAVDIKTPHSLSGGFHIDRGGLEPLRLQISDGRAALSMQGRVPFEQDVGVPDEGVEPGTVDPPAPPEGTWDLTFNAYEWPLDSIRPWLEFDLYVDGRISGALKFTADEEASQGTLRAEVSEARLLDIELDSLGGWLDWDAERLHFGELTLRSPAGEMAGLGTLTWPLYDGNTIPSGGSRGEDTVVVVDEKLDMSFKSAALEMGASPLSGYLPRSDLRGALALEAHLGGSRDRPRLDLQVQADEIALGTRRLAGRSSALDVSWADDQVKASGRLLDMVTVNGGGMLDRERGDLAFDLDGNDVAGLLELLYEEPPGEVGGSFGGRLRVAGEVGQDKDIVLELDAMDVDFRGRRLTNLEPVVMSLHPDHVKIHSFSFEEQATGSELFIAGNLGWAESAPLDLRLQSRLANSWLQLYQPSLDLDGHFDLVTRIGGTVAAPYLDGQASIRASRLVLDALPDFPHQLEDIEGLFLFYPEGMVVDHLEAALAGGKIRLTGRSTVPRDGEPLDYRLRAEARGLRMRYPAGWLLEGDADLSLHTQTGMSGNAPNETTFLVTGRTDLRGLEYTDDIPMGFAQIVQETLLERRLEVAQADQLLSAIQLNVDVEGPGALKVRNNLAELTGSIDLALRGSMAQPIFFGTVDLDPDGELEYSSVDYEIDRGRLVFNNPYEIAPEVDLVATTRVRDFDVTLSLSGSMDRMNASFTSEPPLPALEVFELLATGGDEALESNTVRRADEIGQEHSMSAASFLYGQAAEVIGERVSNLFGFDKFRIAPLTGSGDNLSKARVTVGKRLSKDVFLSYSADPASTEEQRLQIEWQVSRGLVLVLTQNGDSSYEADARWETSF